LAADFSWTPPLLALLTGAVLGVLVVLLRARFRADPATAPRDARTSDLQRRYDALIRRLAEGDVTPEERTATELEAARVLMALESKDAPETSPSPGAPAATTVAPKRPTPAWVGFAWGVVSMGVLGGLVYLASRGSTERAEGGSPTGGMAASGAMTAAGGNEDAALRSLEDAVRNAPRDIPQRIELARAYLQKRDLMKVFEQTKAVLEIEPGEPHALTYQALVRVAMGQADQAETMLVEAIRKNPRIEDAYIHLAIARIQLGKRKAAEDAIAAGQKEFPEDKEQLAQVFAQLTEATGGTGGGRGAEHPESASPSVTETAPSSPTVVVIDLPKGLQVSPNAILFVIAREAGFASGPPVAVKRVPATNFPITVSLTDADSMAGESLPGLIRIDARVDRDGDPLTKDPRDPIAAEDNVRKGVGQVLLVLGPAK